MLTETSGEGTSAAPSILSLRISPGPIDARDRSNRWRLAHVCGSSSNAGNQSLFSELPKGGVGVECSGCVCTALHCSALRLRVGLVAPPDARQPEAVSNCRSLHNSRIAPTDTETESLLLSCTFWWRNVAPAVRGPPPQVTRRRRCSGDASVTTAESQKSRLLVIGQ